MRTPRNLSVELSRVLGTLIAERLPSREARPWRKALAKWENHDPAKTKNITPDISWPIDVVLFAYPGKQFYGQGELIAWELKLIGNSADHGHLIELILPAMEEASKTSDPRWHRQNSLWGRFDIDAIYAARGPQWEPIVRDGKLDLRYRATPTQWSEGLSFAANSKHALDRLIWIAPFDLQPAQEPHASIERAAPTLPCILEALAARINAFVPGKRRAELWDVLTTDDRAALRDAIEQASQFPFIQQSIEPAPKGGPGRWVGSQKFYLIPDPLIPYLELASILHIGRQTHFGCGTFILEASR